MNRDLKAPALIAARGFAMGAADIVPGVSGGTIALILGIYERLIESVRSGARSLGRLVRGDLRGFVAHLARIEWAFIVPLLVGIGAAVLALSSLIDRLLHDEPEAMAGLFLGLIVASIAIAWRLIDSQDSTRVAVAVVVSVVAFALLGLQSGAAASPPTIAYFLSGALAICAMILPGISGSFILLMIGMYGAVIGALDDRQLVDLGLFVIGAVIGLALFSSLLGYVLDRHRDTLLAALVGLMAGSVRVLWPWPNGVGVIGEEEERVDGTAIDLPASWSNLWVPLGLAVVAVIVVLGLDRLGRSGRAQAA